MIALPGVTIRRKIYESSASLVYRGTREEDGRAIVIKLLKQDYPSAQELTRYRQEYAITRSLNLEGVIKAYSQQDYQRTLVMLLEDFGGESLEYWMRQHPVFCPMPLTTFLQFAINLTDILGKIHAANIIHKDINPGNIVLNPDTGVVKIIDFGIATQFNRTNPTFKSAHVLEGTLAYLSPEQTGRMNRAIDYRTDFYSLGVTFYQLLTGQLPFPATDVLELVHCHIAKQPVPPHEVEGVGCGVSSVGEQGGQEAEGRRQNTDGRKQEIGDRSQTDFPHPPPPTPYTPIPKAVSDIVMKLMAKNAEDRYQSAWGIKADLERCAEQLAASGYISHIQLGLQDVSDQFQIPQKLYGRGAEIATLLAAFERVAAGEGGESGSRGVENDPTTPTSPTSEMMLVSGYSGVGKSALVQELYKPITAKRGYFISGKFDQFQCNIPYSAIVDALRKLVQQLLGEPDEQVQQWRSQLLNALGSNGQLIIDVIPEVELIIGKQSPVAEVGATEAQNRFNRVFQQFIRVFCAKEHPLVIFLDDLQWVDSATLKLIELMLLDEQTQFLFLIGAYRDNEVSPTHPLVLTLEGLLKQGAVLHQIALSPLTLEPLSKLIAEALHRDAYTVLPLAELVLRKTGGNPLFVCEFLRLLYSENLLRFDSPQSSLAKGGSKGGWRWNLDQIRALNITDNVNVVELLLNKLKKLPEVSRQLLQLAACVGAEFDLATLAIVAEQSPKTIFQNLLTSIQAGLIQPLSELDKDLLVQDYKFLHDRVQQAAYALIDPSQKQIVRLQIGRNLREKTSPEQLSDRLFEMVDHLNYGIELVSDQTERDKIAKLNLLAGQKAKGAIAYTAALKYLTTGIKLLTADSWQRQYDLSLALYLEATEVAYLSGNFDQIEKRAAVVLQQAKTVLDRMKVYEVKIQTCIAQSKQIQAIKIGLQVLGQLEVSLPEIPTELDVQQKLMATKAALASRSTELANLPVMTNANKLAAMHILSSITGSAYIAAPNLFLLIVLEQLNLSIKYGNAHFSTFAYACYGILLNTVSRDIEEAYQFGCLALSLVERLNANSLKSKTFHVVGLCLIHRKYHVRETLPLLKKAYSSGIESGDLEFAGYSLFVKCQYSYWSGLELVELNKELTICSQTLAQLKQGVSLSYSQLFQQVALNLSSTPENPCYLSGNAYNQEKLFCTGDAVNKAELFYFYLHKLVLCYLFGEFFKLINYAVLAEQYLGSAPSSVTVSIFYFYDSLARLAVYSSVSISEQKDLLLKVNSNQAEMQIWVQHAPMNYRHKFHLVEAEKARVLGQVLEAEEFYEQAIAGASKNEYIQEEALAYELAAKFYLGRGRKKFAQTYMKEAHYCYERWGAMAKVKDLETRYPQLFPQSLAVETTLVLTTTGTISNTPPIAFDWATAMKAAVAISREIELEQLLRSLMQILIENAGAQTGCLILEISGEWAIEAACEFNESKKVYTTQVLQSIPMAGRLPESVIQYVIRTHESVIWSDATCEGNFLNDSYIQQNQTRSLLCLPLLNQCKLVGVLYLENQLASGAFTPERSRVLNLLSTQAAIAIENAKLYSKLRASESQMTQFLEAIPVGIGIIDAAGRPYYANQRAIQLVGKGIDPSVPPDQISEVYQFYVAGTNQIYPTERLPVIQALSGERTTVDDIDIHQNNAIIPIEAWGTPVFDEQGDVVYAISAFQDITERKQSEKLLANYNRTLEQQVTERTLLLSEEIEERQRVENALRQSEEQRRLTMDFTYIGGWNWNIVKNTVDWDDNHIRLLGLVPGEVESSYQAWRDRVHPDDIERVEQAAARALATHTDFEAEYRVIYPDGNVHWLVGRGRGIYNQVGQPVQMLGVILDISDRKRAEAASILEERNRMAREIHDTLAQAFTGILVQVTGATQVLMDDLEATQAHLEMIDELARSGLTEARRSVTALRPQLLEEGDLSSALHRLVVQMRSTTDTALICEIQGTAYSLPAEVENNLLRIGQEALTNAMKHAEASEIRVKLTYENTRCVLQVQDDGQGFGVGNPPLSGGFGLLGMSERATNIGAQLTIQSQLGEGTEIVVAIGV